MVMGEITTDCYVDIDEIVRDTLRRTSAMTAPSTASMRQYRAPC